MAKKLKYVIQISFIWVFFQLKLECLVIFWWLSDFEFVIEFEEKIQPS